MNETGRSTEDLPELLRHLSDPVTPYTAVELRCRIEGMGWDRCLPILRFELQSSSGDVQRLVLAVISEEADRAGSEVVQSLLPDVIRCLSNRDRLVRQAAVLAVGSLGVMTDSLSDALRTIVIQDESAIAREALIVLVQLDITVITEIAGLLRSRWSQ